MRNEERLLIRGLASGDAAAEDEFVSLWSPRIHKWIAQRARYESVDDYAQEVWSHLLEDACRRLLQWKGLYDDHAWHANSLRFLEDTDGAQGLRPATGRSTLPDTGHDST